MTPAYCSPEQADLSLRNKLGVDRATLPKLTKQTDIWSWGVSVLEMFYGQPPCVHGGQIAAEVLKSYLEEADPMESWLPRMPEEIGTLLLHCFQREIAERPKEMNEIAAALQEIYQNVTGRPYHRHAPQPAKMLADSLNNRAVSFLDIGNNEKAEKWFTEALQIQPDHPEANYNQGICMWRSGRMTDTELIIRLENLRTLKDGDWKLTYLVGLVHLERIDRTRALKLLNLAVNQGGGKEAKAAWETASLLPLFKSPRCERTFDGHTASVNSIVTAQEAS